MALFEGLGMSFSLTLFEVGAEDACAIASHQTFRRSEESYVEDSEHTWHFVKALGGRSA